MRVLSGLFRRLFLETLGDAHQAGTLRFFGEHQILAEAKTFTDWLTPVRQIEWVAIANSRLLIALDERGATFKWKDYRAKE